LIGTVMRLAPVFPSTWIKAHLNPASTKEPEVTERVVVAPDTDFSIGRGMNDEMLPVNAKAVGPDNSPSKKKSGELATSTNSLSGLKGDGGELHSVVVNPPAIAASAAGSGGAAVVKVRTAWPVAVSNEAVDLTRSDSPDGRPTVDAVVDSPVRVSAAADAVAAKTRSAARAAINKAGARRRLLRLDIDSFRRGLACDAGG
jgi:hypothetical protein